MSDTLEKIAEECCICQKCALASSRAQAVPGAGSRLAKIMFIGEGPGRNEDEQGLPFVGAAGKVLDSLLAGIGLKREEVFIANVVKCRPPQNRDPLPEEVLACAEYLNRQVSLIAPQLIVLLGRHSMERFLPGLKISLDHGRPKRRNGQVYFPIYHPAAAIYRRELMNDLEKDFRKIPKILQIIEGEKSSALQQESLL